MRLAVYPVAGEATITYRVVDPLAASFARLDLVISPPDPNESAVRRARRRLRLYAAHNGPVYLWTVTYGGDGEWDALAARRHIRGLFRRLRELVGERFPYAWVTEWHPGGHGIHVHFAVDRFIAHATVVTAWQHGKIVHVSGPKRREETGRGAARRVARYIAKYLAKDVSLVPVGRHRYDVAQGFQPQRLVFEARTRDEACDLACEVMGAVPDRFWESRDSAEWQGPATIWMGWS